jgi:nucleoside-diphosphate-sugar epimerase
VARKPVVLVTGASGEMGHSLIHHLAERGTFDVLALDLRAMDPEVARRSAASPSEEF